MPVHLSGPQVASAAVAMPSSLDGLHLPPSLACRGGRRFRGLLVRAATVVSPKVIAVRLGPLGEDGSRKPLSITPGSNVMY